MKYVLHSDTSAIWLYWQVSGATDRGREKTSKPKSSWGWWSIYVGVKLLGHFFLCLTYCVLSCSVVSHSVILWTVAHQAPLSVEFSRQEYCSGLPFPSPGDLPDPGIEPASLTSPAFFTTSSTWEAQKHWTKWQKVDTSDFTYMKYLG